MNLIKFGSVDERASFFVDRNFNVAAARLNRGRFSPSLLNVDHSGSQTSSASISGEGEGPGMIEHPEVSFSPSYVGGD
jgi:hypothetical protein